MIENPDEYVLGGTICFWVKGKNLFAFKDWGPDATYGYYTLQYLIEFLTDDLVFHISGPPFPVKTKATNGVDMVEETALVKSDVKDQLGAYAQVDWANVNREVMGKIDYWICHSGFLGNRGGTFLPNLYVRRVCDKIELSWDNRHPHDNGENKFYLLHKKGVEYVDLKLYRDVVMEFCLAYIENIQEKEPDCANSHRENLQKAIDMKLVFLKLIK